MTVSLKDPTKAKLAGAVARLMFAIDRKCDRETEPCATIHRAVGYVKEVIETDWQATADLSYSDFGELMFEAVMCTCEVKVERFKQGTDELLRHDVNCDMWDSHAG